MWCVWCAAGEYCRVEATLHEDKLGQNVVFGTVWTDSQNSGKTEPRHKHVEQPRHRLQIQNLEHLLEIHHVKDYFQSLHQFTI